MHSCSCRGSVRFLLGLFSQSKVDSISPYLTEHFLCHIELRYIEVCKVNQQTFAALEPLVVYVYLITVTSTQAHILPKFDSLHKRIVENAHLVL